jgi:ATP-dependent Lon protease
MRPDRIPLFPLNVVLLPGADLPLHIFEPRYRKMVRDCFTDHCEFGILLALPSGVAHVGCTAEITQVLKRYPDGRMDIMTAGRAPFRIVELLNVEAYDDDDELLQGDVDYLEDRDRPGDTKTQRDLIDLYEACHTLIFNDYPKNIQDQVPENLSYVVACALPLDLLWKQQILELRSEADRQERLVAYLREWAPRLQKGETLRYKTAKNSSGLN